MRIGIFGGTFDPPHLGHLILADEAYAQLELDRLLWVLTPDPPHKLHQSITPLVDRLDMLRATIAENNAFELSMVDIERAGPHYAVDTLLILERSYPGDALIYVMGGDSLRDLPNWYRPLELLKACHTLGVVRRPGDALDLPALEAKLPGLTRKVRFIDAPLLEISSSDIRQRIAANRPARYFLPEGVLQIIRARNLYP